MPAPENGHTHEAHAARGAQKFRAFELTFDFLQGELVSDCVKPEGEPPVNGVFHGR